MKGEWVFIPAGKMPQKKGWWARALEDPTSGEPSISRIGTAWCLFVLTPAMMTLACLGLFPAETAVKWSLGLLAAPAVVYGLNSAAGAWRREVKPIHKGPGGDSNDLLTEVASTEYE